MAKKKANPGGAAHRRQKGVKAIVVPLSEDERWLIKLAAGTLEDHAVTRFVAAAALAAAHARLAVCGIDPKKIPRNS